MSAKIDIIEDSIFHTLKLKIQCFLICLFFVSAIATADQVSFIDIHEAKKLHDQGVLFVDTRSWIERKLGKIEGAVAMQKSEVIDVAQYLISDKHKEVVMYCAVGSRATVAAANLKKLGYSKIYVVANGQGYSHWKKAGYPTSR